jgi:hypothetical protein
MKKIILLYIPSIIISACISAPQQATPTVPIEFTLVPTLVVEENTAEESNLPAYFPQPGDSALTKGSAIANNTYVIFSNGDPVEVILHISGYLPTPCHELRVKIPAPDQNGDIYVETYSLTQPDQICEQVLRAYDLSINIGSYPKGSYWVYVNGGRVGNFDY